MTLATISCSKKPEDIKLSELKTSCDYVDALEIVLDKGISLFKNKKIEDFSPEEKSYLETLKIKLKQIVEAGEKKFTDLEFEECSNFKKVYEKIDEFDEKWMTVGITEEVIAEEYTEIKEEKDVLDNKTINITTFIGEWTNNINTCKDEIARQENLTIKYENSTKNFIISGWEWYGIINSINNDEFTISGFSEGDEFKASYKFSSDMGNLNFKFIKGDYDMIGVNQYFKCK